MGTLAWSAELGIPFPNASIDQTDRGQLWAFYDFMVLQAPTPNAGCNSWTYPDSLPCVPMSGEAPL